MIHHLTQRLTTEHEIKSWLEGYNILKYTLIPHETQGFVVDVDGSVSLVGKRIAFIPVQFNVVSEDFAISYNSLTSLQGCPRTVGRHFLCQNNQLDSLQFCPQEVKGIFNCSQNRLASLEYCPQKVKGSFYCSDNPLLGDTQNILFFKDIYPIHEKIHIEKEKNDLLKTIDTKPIFQKPSFKI